MHANASNAQGLGASSWLYMIVPAIWTKAIAKARTMSSGRGRSPRAGANKSRHRPARGLAGRARSGTRSPRLGRAVAVRSVVATRAG
jgi:hypothetical protein